MYIIAFVSSLSLSCQSNLHISSLKYIIDLLAILKKNLKSNDTLAHFVEFSNVHNSDRSSNATRSNLVYKNV